MEKIAYIDRSHAMDISRITKSYIENSTQKNGRINPLTVKMEFSNKVESLQLLMEQGYINLNITFLSEKLWPVTWKQKFTSVLYGKNRKMQIKNVKIRISKNKKYIFSCPKDYSVKKNRFLDEKVCSVAC